MDLDDAVQLRKLDTGDMLGLTAGYARQFRDGWELAQDFEPPRPARVDEVLVLGTGGGSAASANLLRSYLYGRAVVPILLNQGYNVPAWADGNTLVLAVTHSGNTEETLSAYHQAQSRGCPVSVITAGGTLAELATLHGAPLALVPGGLMPRAALGYIFLPLLGILAKLDLAPDPAEELNETLGLLEELAREWGPAAPTGGNVAKQVALALQGHIPVVYGTLDHMDAVAWRWKNQFGENSKHMAFWNAIPCLHHDEAVGWDMDRALLKSLAVVLLRDRGDSEKVARRLDVTREMLQDRMGRVLEVHSRGQGLMARVFSLVMLGDFVTIYLAVLSGADPTPVEIIQHFKRQMGQRDIPAHPAAG